MSLASGTRIPLKRGPKPQVFEEAPITTPTDDPPEFESHIVLRVPEDCVDRIEKIIETDGKVEDFAINLNSDARNSTLRIGNRLLNGKILDLPTITEVHKTLDDKSLYKVADVSQILVCTHDSINAITPSALSDVTEDPQAAAKKAAKQWQYPHGLTPPMKCARKKRFRKTKKKKLMDAPEVETELKRLLRADLEADSVRWEIVEGGAEDGGGVDEGVARTQGHVNYPSSSDEESDPMADDDEKEE
ncbi:Protein CBR-TAF-7.2 [Caenorhabditis briggsae]|uniref:Protein CBR-TAF-7.2 n=1 Tax=Caenorhabditis briggsae TaxID=6238 RepID=A8WVC3_CAEBR|nr:Protein CBR-TAF-7.2 [Caenorhabditis briggsae]CAP24434.2 Protein CBR-TAF-7.2 [Caenorhabditis briggsae]